MPADSPIPRRLVGRLAAIIFLFASLTNLTKLVNPPTLPISLPALVVLTGLLTVIAGIAWWCPWHRWPRTASLPLVPLGLTLITVSNLLSTEPYTYALYFIVAFVWIGVAHRSGTAIAFVPLLAVAYIVPIWILNQLTPGTPIALIRTLIVCALVGETLAWLSQQAQRNQVSLAQRESETRFRSLVQHSSDMIVIVAADATIVYSTPSLERVLGQVGASSPNRSLIDLLHPHDRASCQELLARSIASPGQNIGGTWRLLHQTGDWRPVEVTMINMLAEPTVAGLVVTMRDRSDQYALEERLRHLAFHDPLTRLANRTLLRDRVDHALANQSSPTQRITVLFLDLDNFKQVNDSLGHSVGDQLLIEVANLLRKQLREDDTAARLGGDEFAVLLTDSGSGRLAIDIAERLIKAIHTPLTLQGREVIVGVSIGIAMTDSGATSVDELFRNADMAMYAAKKRGKGTYAIFEGMMHNVMVKQMALSVELHRAVERQEFELLYQPIVNLRTGRITGIEVLLRWRHPEHGLLAPASFIGQAEETGLIIPIGEWVIQQACHQLSRWQADRPIERTLDLHINLSGRQFRHPDLVECIKRTLQRTQLTSARLVFEVTEGTLMGEAEATTRRLAELKQLGVGVAVDDFGTGASSLRFLQHVPIDLLKIDQSITSMINGNSDYLVHALVRFCTSLTHPTQAEGIETVAQLALLQALGCQFGQGTLFMAPAGAEVLTRLLSTNDQFAVVTHTLTESAA